MNIRVYNQKKDLDAALRIMEEAGWFDHEKTEKNRNIFNQYFTAGNTLVADIQDTAESLAVSMPGTFRYLHEELPLCAIATVATSRIARRQGLASGLMAESLAAAAVQGALVAGLGAFEQGFYERFGFGAGPYEHYISFHPASLKIDKNPTPPKRLTVEDWEAVHASRLSRMKGHGSCNLKPHMASRFEMVYISNCFGLGYFDEAQRLTHHLWMSIKGEQGPGEIWWMSYQNYDQFIELMALVKSLGDQLLSVEMTEPPGIQFQDLLNKPFAKREITKRNRYASYMEASAYWLLRILDLPGCIEKIHLKGDAISFNLELHDPVKKYVDSNSSWQGVDGQFVIDFGETSSAADGHRSGLPTLRASVGAFTRFWMGAGSATGLSATDEFDGPKDLLISLDEKYVLPTPRTDWDF